MRRWLWIPCCWLGEEVSHRIHLSYKSLMNTLKRNESDMVNTLWCKCIHVRIYMCIYYTVAPPHYIPIWYVMWFSLTGLIIPPERKSFMIGHSGITSTWLTFDTRWQWQKSLDFTVTRDNIATVRNYNVEQLLYPSKVYFPTQNKSHVSGLVAFIVE